MTPRLSILTVLGLVALAAAPASAQRLWVGAAVQRDVQQFPEDVVPNRLDGSATGWRVGASARVRSHLALSVEWSDAGTIEDTRTTRLDFNGRPIAITSTSAHRTRALAVLAGYGHGVTTRVGIAYLVGAAFTDVRREFTSNAGGLVLVSPSNPGGSGGPPVVDRFQTLTGGVDAHVRVTGRLHAVSGIRAQRIVLSPDLTGWSIRTFFGAGWAF